MSSNRLFRLIVSAAALLCAAGCDTEQIGALYSGPAGFSFASGVMNVEVTEEDQGQILIPVYRGDLDSNGASVSFSYDISAPGSDEPVWVQADPDGLFSLTSKNVIFADGLNTAYAQIRLADINRMGVTDKYKMKLTIMEGLSPSEKGEVVVTVSRKLTFRKYGDCTYFDEMVFEKAYRSEIYKAEEGDIYRVTDPYKEGLIAEDYAAEGWMGATPEYVQFICDSNGRITFQEFQVGMLVNATHMAWAYYPSTYKWGKDFSDFDAQNKKLSDKHFQLCAVYCLPTFKYGFLNDGTGLIDIQVD